MINKNPMRVTHQRRVILEELRKVTSHPTAVEIYQMVRKRIPRISLGTVYRNLVILADSGMIQQLHIAGTEKRFDGVRENHYHVRCVKCGRVDDVPMEPMSIIEASVTPLVDYEILSHRLELIGLCPTCRRGHGRNQTIVTPQPKEGE